MKHAKTPFRKGMSWVHSSTKQVDLLMAWYERDDQQRLLKMVQSMKENGISKTKEMVRAYVFIQVTAKTSNTKAIGKTAYLTAEGA